MNARQRKKVQQITKAFHAEVTKAKIKQEGDWYSPRSLFGNDWAIFYFLLGGREAGKSYAITEMYVRQWRKYKRPFYWLRLTEGSSRKLLMNNAEKLIDPDLRRKYNLELRTNGNNVYEVKLDADGKIVPGSKKLMARVYALNTFYNDKGSGLFDKDFLDDPNMYYNICLDEMNREANEKNSFDIVYSFANQLENLVRSTKSRIRVVCIGNTLQEASDLLCAFNFLPEKFGRYFLKKKRAVIDYIEPSEEYLKRREGTVADILAGESSTFTNMVEVDRSLVVPNKTRLNRPTYLIKFRKDRSKWFTVWDSGIIAQYNGEKCTTVLAMRPYLDERYTVEVRDQVIMMFDSRSYLYKNFMTFKVFQKEVETLKPRK